MIIKVKFLDKVSENETFKTYFKPGDIVFGILSGDHATLMDKTGFHWGIYENQGHFELFEILEEQHFELVFITPKKNIEEISVETQ